MGQALVGEGENHRVESQETPGKEKEGFTRALAGRAADSDETLITAIPFRFEASTDESHKDGRASNFSKGVFSGVVALGLLIASNSRQVRQPMPAEKFPFLLQERRLNLPSQYEENRCCCPVVVTVEHAFLCPGEIPQRHPG